MKTYPLSSATVVITGASSGIGKAAALYFAREGANIVLAARSDTLLQEIASQCEDIGGQAIAVATDVSDKESVHKLFATALSYFGEINVWINNAGIAAVGDFIDTPLEAHEQIIKTNLLGPLYSSYVVLPYFRSRGKGIIINTNSTGAYVGNPFTVAYSASKFGLRGFSESLRSGLKDMPEIFICDIFAGLVDSPGHSHAANYIGKEIRPAHPLIDPERVAKTMVKLAKNPKPSTHLGVQDRFGRLGLFVSKELTGKILEKAMRKYFNKAKKAPITDGNVFAPDYDRTYIHGGFS